MKSFEAYILSQDENISRDPSVQAVKQAASLHATRRRKEEIMDDFLVDLFANSFTDKFVQRISGSIKADESDITRLQGSGREMKDDKVRVMQMLNLTAEQVRGMSADQLKSLSEEQVRLLSAGYFGKGFETELAKKFSSVKDVNADEKRVSFGNEEQEQYFDQEPLGLADFPSLRDLETSNLFSHNFQATKAAKLALQHFDEAKRKQMEGLVKTLDAKASVKFHDFVKGLKDKKTKGRQAATSAFGSILAFAQVGTIDLI